jgi:hypothetical protein
MAMSVCVAAPSSQCNRRMEPGFPLNKRAPQIAASLWNHIGNLSVTLKWAFLKTRLRARPILS